ncbi:MAG: amino acid permease, partial [Brevibacterium aurantiacum]|nr:amino acid permease [Brevibacterium aurantiacum]
MSQATTRAPNTQNELHRNLKSRHINLIAIGGAIGTGLFVATGASVSSAGPGGALLSYAVIGLAVFFVMNALGEMATHTPVPGAFEAYSRDYVDPAFGFMMGWNYWYASVMTIAVELVAASIVMKFWFPDSNSVLWSALFLVILLALNLFSARVFGEGEFWFAGIKVVTIIVFIIVGVLMIAGIMGGKAVGFQNWTIGEAPFVGGAMGTFGILMVAGFSFVGVEATAIAAGEADNPTKTMPRAINSVFWRILIFYIGAIAVMASLIPYTDPNLLQASEENIAASPFTLIFERAGLAAAASVINAVILTSVLSAGNSTLYSGSRLVYSMARGGSAPRVLGRVTKWGVPIFAVLFTAVVSSVAFLTSQVGDSIVYTWLYNATGLAGFVAWLGICIAHLRFRAGYRAQGRPLSELKYKARLYPYG